MRLLADVIRGGRVDQALAWLKTCPAKRAQPLHKVVASAFANVKNTSSAEGSAAGDFVIDEIRVDQGPSVRYFRAGAMGRAEKLCRRSSHLFVKVAKKAS